MTGCMLMADDFCLVIAEGSLKSHKKYSRLMLNRIDWNQSLEDEQQGQFHMLLCGHLKQAVQLLSDCKTNYVFVVIVASLNFFDACAA